MAHFAELNDSNEVINLIVINNFDILDEDGKESEAIGIALAKEITNSSNDWVQTSYNNNFRKQLGEPGFTYDETKDIFIAPKPYASWTLDDNSDWQPPIAKPDYDGDGSEWWWQEDENKWGKLNSEGEWVYNE
tara:strand:- start:367 stop:765 length:399 start_codon:yes stop_codon:yes gene_type:complete